MITLTRAPAYVTVQDLGRMLHRASGVPRSGAMDRPALVTVNHLVGNAADAAGLEWALSAGEMSLGAPTSFALGGADTDCLLDETVLEPYRAYAGNGGSVLSVGAPRGGRFTYFAFAGGIDCVKVLGSRSTYLPGSLGGIEGRRLKTGDVLRLNAPARTVQPATRALPETLHPPRSRSEIRIVPHAEALQFDFEGHGRHFTVSNNSDRTGYRLEGTPAGGGASITSEPVCDGAVQLPPSGMPVILMADAPTIGGYRIVGTVISADLGALAQRIPGEPVSLVPVTIAEAQRELRRIHHRLQAVAEWASA